MTEILPNLYLGSIADAMSSNYNAVISMCQTSIKYKNSVHYIYDIDDDILEDILKYLPELTEIIEKHLKKGDKILVHCVMGMSRSASVVIAYLMQYKRMNYASAYHYTKSKRPIVNPNPGFVQQLKEYALLLSKKPNDIEKAKKVHKMNSLQYSTDFNINDYMEFVKSTILVGKSSI